MGSRLGTWVWKRGRLVVVAVACGVIIASLWFYVVTPMLAARTISPDRIVRDADGQPVVVDELIIVGGSAQRVRTAVEELGGVLMTPEGDGALARARFRVSTLIELDEIQRKLREKGVNTAHHWLMEAPRVGQPQ